MKDFLNDFTHYGPFEGTETLGRRLHLGTIRNFTHYGPFEGTETLLDAAGCQHWMHFTHYGPFEGTETPNSFNSYLISFGISLTMARLRVLKQILERILSVGNENFTHYGPFEGTETTL